MPGELYREEAIKHLEKSQEQHYVTRIITPKSWIYLLAFIIFFLSLISWLLWGIITQQVQGVGIIIVHNFKLITVDSKEYGGFVNNVSVKPGDVIRKGQVIVTISNPKLNNDIHDKEKHLSKEQHELDILKETANKAIKARMDKTNLSLREIKEAIVSLNEKKKLLGNLMQNFQKVRKKGIISGLQLSEITVAYFNSIADEKTLIKESIALQQNLNKEKEDWNHKIRDKEEKVRQLQFDLNHLKSQKNMNMNIVSPVNAKVFAVYVNPGDYLTINTAITDLVTAKGDFEAIGFFNVQQGKKIKVGMTSKIIPDHINELEYGALKAKVYYVSDLPINPGTLKRKFENKTLDDVIFKQGPVIEAKFKFFKTDTTPSGFEWTTSKGPNEQLSLGTMTKAIVIVKELHPIDIVIPVMKSTKNWILGSND